MTTTGRPLARSAGLRTVDPVTYDVWWIAAGSALSVCGGTVLAARQGWQVRRGRLRRVRPRHRAPRNRARALREATEPPVEDVELARSPQTGRLASKGVQVAPPEDVAQPPAPRGGTAPDDGTAAPAGTDASTPLPVITMTIPSAIHSHEELAKMLEDAWRGSDVESLAAHGQTQLPSATAALLLAGIAGRRIADPRAEHWLYCAFLSGEDPAVDQFAAPLCATLSLVASFPLWNLELPQLPCTREGLGLSVAAAEVAAGDFDAAYGVLLATPHSPRVAALRALVAARLDWWSRSVIAADSYPVDTAEWGPLLAILRAEALERQGHVDAAGDLDRALALLEDEGAGPWQGGADLFCRALFARAGQRRAAGDADGAWQDLSRVLERDPGFPGAATVLKEL